MHGLSAVERSRHMGASGECALATVSKRQFLKESRLRRTFLGILALWAARLNS